MDPIQAPTQEQGDNNTQERSQSILREVACVYFTRSSNQRHFSPWTWQSIYWPKYCTPVMEAQGSWPCSQQPTVVSRPWHNTVLATKFPTRTACLANLILVDFVALAGCGSTCPLWSSPLRYFVHLLLPPDILISTLFSDTLILCSSVRIRNQVSHPNKTWHINICVKLHAFRWGTEIYCIQRKPVGNGNTSRSSSILFWERLCAGKWIELPSVNE